MTPLSLVRVVVSMAAINAKLTYYEFNHSFALDVNSISRLARCLVNNTMVFALAAVSKPTKTQLERKLSYVITFSSPTSIRFTHF